MVFRISLTYPSKLNPQKLETKNWSKPTRRFQLIKEEQPPDSHLCRELQGQTWHSMRLMVTRGHGHPVEMMILVQWITVICYLKRNWINISFAAEKMIWSDLSNPIQGLKSGLNQIRSELFRSGSYFGSFSLMIQIWIGNRGYQLSNCYIDIMWDSCDAFLFLINNPLKI